MDSLEQEKNLLRTQVKSLSSNVEISLTLFFNEVEVSKGLWGVFNPLKDEPVLKDKPENIEFCWPGIVDEAQSEMVFSKSEGFKKSDLGFLEPSTCKAIPKNDISVIFVPGQAFDFKGNRLGRGKGFYDRYLRDFSGVTVGVCSRERFLTKPVPVDQVFDVAVQYVLTEEFLYKVNPFGKVV
ncbi:MAG: 5-formyltetrahydrofolate cyclo-ligase [Bdellovibrionales bacterium]